jgi:restriction endonuclease S subunit
LFFRLQVNEGVKPQYIAYILDFEFLKKQMKFNLTANNAVDYLEKKLIQSLLIPLPATEKQTEIANHISAIHSQAKQLQQAAAELEQAKQQVETMILGK